MVKVAVIAHGSQSQSELEAIRGRLRTAPHIQAREFLSLDQINGAQGGGLTSFDFNVLLLRIENFGLQNVPMLMKIKNRFPKQGVVLLAGDVDPNARFQVRGMPGVKILREDTELDDTPLLLEKLARGEDHPLRLHSRVRRDGEAALVDEEAGMRLDGHFINFAQMGARLWVQSKHALKTRDRFQVHYRSSVDPGRTHRIESVIVWQQLTSNRIDRIMYGPQQVVGVRFIAAL